MRRLKWFGLSALVGVLLAATAGPAAALPNNVIEFIRGYGSDGTYDIMVALDVAFNGALGCNFTGNTGRPDGLTSNPDGSCTPPIAPGSRSPENHDHDFAITFGNVGSSNGIKTLDKFGTVDFCGGTADQPYPGPSCSYASMDYARSSRARSGSDSTNLRFVAFARVAVPWVNWREGTTDEDGGTPCATNCTDGGPAEGVFNLTTQNVKDIYLNCALPSAITHWNEVGGTHIGQADDEIVIWAVQSGSGTRSSFLGFLGSGTDDKTCVPTQYKDGNTSNGERVIFENDASPIKNCATHAGGSCHPALGADTYLSSIYYFSSGAWFNTPLDGNGDHGNGADLGWVGGIEPTSANIGSGAYTFSGNINNVYRNTYPTNNIPVHALDYVGEKGWICKGSAVGSGLPDEVSAGDTDLRGGHVVNPKSGVNYSVEINGDTDAAIPYASNGVIKKVGFVPLPFAAIGGGVTGDSHCRVS